MNFRLLGRDSPMARITYLPQGVAPPVAIKGRLPKYKPPAPSTFHLSFDVSETGDVENLTCAEPAPESILERHPQDPLPARDLRRPSGPRDRQT